MRCLAILVFSTFAAASPVPRELVASGRLDELRWPDFSDFKDEIVAFYTATGYEPVWTRDGSITPQAVALIEVLKQAATKGLDPDDYDAPRWAARMAHPDPARFDVALSVSAMRYVSDLHIGRWNPGIYHSRFDPHGEHDEIAEWIRRSLVSAPDVPSTLRGIEPPFPGYQRTQTALQRYLDLMKTDDGTPLPPAKLPIEPGAAYAGVPRLAALLRSLGDLPAGSPVTDIYQGPLVDAVRRFQTRHGLESDGRIGKATLAQLNTPLSHRVHQLQLTLERWRWVPQSFSRPPIVVNIPEFQLRALNASFTTALQMKVVVGAAYRRQTPVFSAEMKYVIFRPYWNVPRSITRAELLPKAIRDRDYLASNGYEVVEKSDQVVATGVTGDEVLAGLKSGQFSIRQVPGPKNSLGLVKFLFPNEYNVYLHDTPATVLFSKARRDFSHGCIRVEKPALLAQWILRDSPEWTPERIDQAMQGAMPLRVDLAKPVPVLIVYATAVVLESGEVHFFDDLYGFDAQLDELEAKGYPCCRWNPTSAALARHPHE